MFVVFYKWRQGENPTAALGCEQESDSDETPDVDNEQRSFKKARYNEMVDDVDEEQQEAEQKMPRNK